MPLSLNRGKEILVKVKEVVNGQVCIDVQWKKQLDYGMENCKKTCIVSMIDNLNNEKL